MKILSSVEQATDQLIQMIGKEIVIAAPLGAGKANHILNSLFKRAYSDQTIKITFLTALTLQKPYFSKSCVNRILSEAKIIY